MADYDRQHYETELNQQRQEHILEKIFLQCHSGGSAHPLVLQSPFPRHPWRPSTTTPARRE